MNDNIFGNLNTDDLEKTRDSLGGMVLFDSGIYEATIKLAYAGNSATSKAQSVNLLLELNGMDYRETFWVTSKTGSNFYLGKSDGKKNPLPSFVTVDELCLLSTGKPLNGQTTEEKVIPLYDFEHKKDLPKNVYVITSILGEKVKVGIQKRSVFKQKKNTSTQEYEDTDEIVFENAIDKVFHLETGKTVNEYRDGKEATFADQWLKKWDGKINESKTKNKTPAAGNSKAVRPEQGDAAGASRPAGSLFSKG
jgi:hypothetical protein